MGKKRRKGFPQGKSMSLAEFYKRVEEGLQSAAASSTTVTATSSSISSKSDMPNSPESLLEIARAEGNFDAVLAAILSQDGSRMAIKGGMLRDVSRGVDFSDIDCICNLTSAELCAALSLAEIDFTAIHGRVNLVILTLTNGRSVDIYPMGEAYSEAKFTNPTTQCDFTINTAFLSIEKTDEGYEGTLHDAFKVCEAEETEVKTIIPAEESLQQDAFRALRAIYYANKLNLKISDSLMQAIQASSTTLASELFRNPRRVLRELSKIFSNGSVKSAYGLFKSSGLAEYIFPVVHSKETLEESLQAIDDEAQSASEKLSDVFELFRSDLVSIYLQASIPKPAEDVALEQLISENLSRKRTAVLRPSYKAVAMQALSLGDVTQTNTTAGDDDKSTSTTSMNRTIQ